MVSIQKVSFGTVKIQKLRRIALPSNLLETLGLLEGDDISVELNVETAEIVIKKIGQTAKALRSARAGAKRV
jgi:bifunctional DNA-binding transcriptional regulator/antitoxin component of YhaV-PrlF toxin-antitoxin module